MFTLNRQTLPKSPYPVNRPDLPILLFDINRLQFCVPLNRLPGSAFRSAARAMCFSSYSGSGLRPGAPAGMQAAGVRDVTGARIYAYVCTDKISDKRFNQSDRISSDFVVHRDSMKRSRHGSGQAYVPDRVRNS